MGATNLASYSLDLLSLILAASLIPRIHGSKAIRSTKMQVRVSGNSGRVFSLVILRAEAEPVGNRVRLSDRQTPAPTLAPPINRPAFSRPFAPTSAMQAAGLRCRQRTYENR